MNRLFWLLLALGCAGEPFTEIDDVSQDSSAGRKSKLLETDERGMAGQATNHSGQGGSGIVPLIGNGGSTIGGVQSAGENGTDSGWLCRTDGELCQCYIDSSPFMPGWLTDAQCRPSNFCSLRDSVACVCWDTDNALESALTVSNTVKVVSCP